MKKFQVYDRLGRVCLASGVSTNKRRPFLTKQRDTRGYITPTIRHVNNLMMKSDTIYSRAGV